jgi:hypothetical protein
MESPDDTHGLSVMYVLSSMWMNSFRNTGA